MVIELTVEQAEYLLSFLSYRFAAITQNLDMPIANIREPDVNHEIRMKLWDILSREDSEEESGGSS